MKGCTYTSLVGIPSEQFLGGCIFVDNMIEYIHVERQLRFLSSETIQAKQSY